MPEPRISWDRHVAGEEQHHNAMNLREARRELDEAATYITATGTPRTFVIDDGDTGTTIRQPMDWDFIAREAMLLNRLEQTLAREGIIIVDARDNQQPT